MEKKYLGFRLLTEYHSFLCKVYSLETIRLGKCVSVSSRSIIHSYKLVKNSAFGGYYLAFPSPYGVLFILMKVEKIIIMQEVECFRLLTEYHSFLLEQMKIGILKQIIMSFRLLTEYHSFLSYGQKSLLLQYFFKVLSCNIFIFEISLFISVKNIFNSSFFRYYSITIFYLIFQEIKTIQKKNFFSFLFSKKSKGSLRISSPLKVKIFSILFSKLITSLTITV